MTTFPISRALISVADKAGVADFAKFLANRGVELLSTGGSAAALEAAGLRVKEVSAHTGFPEIMDGRVKTLHPRIHGGLLGRRDHEEDIEAMADYGIQPIDLLVSNLYPFEETVARGAGFEETLEQIDVGGPAMIRAAAKNHAFVTVATSPQDYDLIMDEMAAQEGGVTHTLRLRLAAAAFARTAAYDAAIADWFAAHRGEAFPFRFNLAGRRGFTLRYGENPHQEAALYLTPETRAGVARAVQVQGKPLSYNNIADADAAFELVAEFLPEFDGPAVAIIKHANPCGVALGDSQKEAFDRALACDPTSAFGGIVAVNTTLEADTAEAIAALFAEVVVAPEISAEARRVLAQKKNLRVLTTGELPPPGGDGVTVRSVAGGFLAQTRDGGRLDGCERKVVTARKPDAREEADLSFAWRVAKHVRSNAIVLARDGRTVGIGAGQMSRVDSVRLAVRKAQEAAHDLAGSVIASDAFFPFPDGLLAAMEAGATACIQPGGSIRDAEVIKAAEEGGLAMTFTGMRHFRH